MGIKTNKVLNILVAASLVFSLSLSTAFATAAPAENTPENNFQEAIQKLVDVGAVKGDTDGLFHPESELTRAQACVILVKTIAPGSIYTEGTATQKPYKSKFTDMTGYAWADSYIAYAVELGIAKGYPDGYFRPGNKVSFNEMITMVLRAAGYSAADIGTNWPEDYIKKAEAEGITAKLAKPYADVATKGMAAQMTFNVLGKIQANAPKQEVLPQGTEKDNAVRLPDTSKMIYANGKFDTAMTTFSGKAISKNVEIMVYGKTSEYSKAMTFSTKPSDFREENLYKYKYVKTPAWYLVENDKITKMILPADVGFTGSVFGVINNTVGVIDYFGSRVEGVETLTAGREITWLTKSASVSLPKDYKDGQVYQFSMENGKITKVSGADSATKEKYFEEFTAGWKSVESFSEKVITFSDGKVIEAADTMTVYLLENGKYEKAGSGDIKKGTYIRTYDATDDDYQAANLIVIK